MKYKNICFLIYNVDACVLGVLTTKQSLQLRRWCAGHPQPRLEGLVMRHWQSGRARNLTQMTWVRILTIASLTWCHLTSLHLQWGLFLLHPSDAHGNLCKVTESWHFPCFCSVPEKFETSPHRWPFASDMDSKDGIRNHSPQCCLITRTTKLEPALEQQGQAWRLQNSTIEMPQPC